LTSVSVLPAKIIQALKRVETENPLVLIDDVDKIGRGINGDPASAVLFFMVVNDSFLFPQSMDVPVDLSHVCYSSVQVLSIPNSLTVDLTIFLKKTHS
jgi:Lon-like ATP-dependent protease